MANIINFPNSNYIVKTFLEVQEVVKKDSTIIIIVGNGDDLQMVTNMQDMNDILDDLDTMIVQLEGEIDEN